MTVLEIQLADSYLRVQNSTDLEVRKLEKREK